MSFRLLSFFSALSFLPRFSFLADSFSSFFRRLCLLCLPCSFSRFRFLDLRRTGDMLTSGRAQERSASPTHHCATELARAKGLFILSDAELGRAHIMNASPPAQGASWMQPV